ncbi:hypothetical protein FRC06_002084 [Ceratobasidium sp. 370]|nr:hypothetical protein FRC06_002084 [Ceratobasidium sp. 370]
MVKSETPINVAIIGAGRIGGLTAAISLQKSLGLHNYTIYERGTDVGGTWRQNTYPGCACDIPAHWYCLSSDPNPDWEWVWASRNEIQAYWKRLSVKHGVESHIEYGSEMVSAVWDEKNKHYTLEIRNVKTRETRQVVAHVVISATGVFNLPRWPNIPGRESFKGEVLHAEHWDHSVSLSGKRVAVIGNGCSASQLIPEISKDSSVQVTNFCRTPSWYLPRPQTHVPSWVRWIFRNVPFVLKALRWTMAGTFELLYHNMKRNPLSNLIHILFEKGAIYYMKAMAPAKYHKDMIPNYPLGCKRIVFDPGYLSSLHRPNVDLEWDSITEITPEGILTKSGKTTPFDVICYATGFDIENSLTLNVTGANGQTLEEYYKREGGPTGYMGTTIPGFPNWVTVFGPNTATGHASVIFAEEMQIDYVAQLLQPILQGKAKSFAPRAEATRSWNDWIQLQLSKYHIWSSCSSWYRAGNQKGKIVALWPGSTTHMWWSFRKPVWGNFEFDGGESWLRKKRATDLLKLMVVPALAVAAAAYVKANPI